MSALVTVELIPRHVRKQHGIPTSETFAVIRRDDGPGAWVLATDEDVPAGVHPEEFGQRIADLRGQQFVPAAEWVEFSLDAGRWSARDNRSADYGDQTVIANRYAESRPPILIRRARVGAA